MKKKAGRFFTIRLFVLAIRGFIQDKCPLRASSLTYYTTISLVPALAMAFAVAGGFGLKDYLKSQLLVSFPENRAVLVDLYSFSDRLLTQTQSEILAGAGVLVLMLIQQLIDAEILIEVKGPGDPGQGYLPKRDINQLRISDVIEALQNMGKNEFPHLTSKTLEKLEGALQSFRQKIDQSEQNRFLKDF